MKIFVDLDRTLLDTTRFTDEIWDFLGTKYNIDATLEKSRIQQFYGKLGYDLFKHLTATGLTDHPSITAQLMPFLSQKSLLFDDALPAIAVLKEIGEVTILTLGVRQLQELKLSVLRDLQQLPAVIVEYSKARYIVREVPESCILIDDKQIAGELPANVRFIHLDRAQTEPVIRQESFVSINSLEHIEQALALQ